MPHIFRSTYQAESEEARIEQPMLEKQRPTESDKKAIR